MGDGGQGLDVRTGGQITQTPVKNFLMNSVQLHSTEKVET